MFTYQTFIDEVVPLRDAVVVLRTKPQLKDDPEFRRWRHHLQDLISKIEAAGYSVNCGISTRDFRPMFQGASPFDMLREYQRDLDDTWIELDLLITSFGKFGSPKMKKEVVASAEMASPHPPKVTIPWIVSNVHLSVWIAFIGIITTAFVAGVAAGQSEAYVAWTTKHDREKTTGTVAR